MIVATEIVTTGWANILKYGLGGVLVLLVLMIAYMFMSGTMTATKLAAFFGSLFVIGGSFGILVFAGQTRPLDEARQEAQLNEYRATFRHVCDLVALKLAAEVREDANATAIARQIAAVIHRDADVACTVDQPGTSSTISIAPPTSAP